ncbi:hypothetical protein BMF94_0269 [Rhodotorula taiwanensis]|uniref:Mini-chromosome maintenance complex-binding protein n=1 Tax=Rhodotorula taiwanensis TaxID=741276 RepID=A0A2S5BIS7_9BASI|nr:hypothetical protein BMF94_0269 [Rhodotorula taiwanensis]
MLADLDLALKRPTELIERLYAEHGSPEGFEQTVSDRFSTLLQDGAALGEVVTLGAATKTYSLPPAGTLVKFRGMVQDTGLGGELYPGSNADGSKLYMYGMEEGASDISPDDYSKLRERQLFYVISVPGETAWAKEKLDSRGTSSSLSLESLKLDGEAGYLSADLPNKNPIPSEPSFGLVAKVYGDGDASLKTTDVREFVGIFGSTSWSTGLEDLTGAEASESAMTVPALHVLYSSPVPQPARAPLPESSESKQAVRDELVEYLAASFGGDRDAAEWLLLALIARIHTRHATGMALGSLSLNLALPDGFESDLASPVASLVPAATTLALTIDSLNDVKTRLAPRSREETLDAGQLQLASGTAVVVDLRKLGEGKLQDTGVRNLRHLATAITQQKVSYEFPYSSFELDTDLNFVLLSEGKAVLPTDCVVYVRPEASGVERPKIDEAKLDRFRSYISTMKHAPFSIPAEMSEVIQSDFVERRQASQGGEAMTQDDLLFRMTAARLLALSYGETALSQEAWRRTADLDDRRKERMPVPPAEAAASA